jgi:hypothetical protein
LNMNICTYLTPVAIESDRLVECAYNCSINKQYTAQQRNKQWYQRGKKLEKGAFSSLVE